MNTQTSQQRRSQALERLNRFALNKRLQSQLLKRGTETQDERTSDIPWPHIPWPKFLDDLRALVEDPLSHVRQHSEPLCGPAAIAQALAERSPHRLVEICIRLYEDAVWHDEGQGHRFSIRAPLVLRRAPPPPGMNPAVWIFLGSLRESRNRMFSLDPWAPEILRQCAGITSPVAMVAWTRALLTLDDVHFFPCLGSVAPGPLAQAQQLVEEGGVAFFLVHHSFLSCDATEESPSTGPKQGRGTPWRAHLHFPNHWISLLPRTRENGYQFFSYGAVYSIPIHPHGRLKKVWGIVQAPARRPT